MAVRLCGHASKDHNNKGKRSVLMVELFEARHSCVIFNYSDERGELKLS